MWFKKLFSALILLTNISLAQESIYYMFDPDSLQGFDEVAASNIAHSQNFLGKEFKIKMYRLKREFIDNKYHLNRRTAVVPFYQSEMRPALPSCVNEDFEASTATVITASNKISGWIITGGSNNPSLPTNPGAPGYNPYFPNGLPGENSCNLMGCCPMPTAHSELIDCSAPGGYFDVTIGPQYRIYSVFGTGTVSGAAAANPQIPGGLFGNKVLRLNDNITGDYSVERISKTFAVTSNNSLFQVAFINVFAPGHPCCDASGLRIRFINATTNSLLACPSISVSVPSAACNITGTTYYNCGNGSIFNPSTNFGSVILPGRSISLIFPVILDKRSLLK